MRRNIGEVRLSYRTIQERTDKIQTILKKHPFDVNGLNREIMELSRFFKERGRPFSY
jgi:hypothetical protein